MSVSRTLVVTPAVSAIGGVMARTAAVVVNPAVLKVMGSRVSSSVGSVRSDGEGAGLFSAGSAVIEEGPEAWVVSDMDLLNRSELAAVVGVTPQDGDLLTRLYAMEGATFVRRLRGAFALAVWDRRRQQLVLATDHLGIRRLYYTVGARWASFASRLTAVLAGPETCREVDSAAIYSYLNFKFVPAPATPFLGVRRLPPGHVLVLRPGVTKLQPYWDMSYPERDLCEERAAARLYRLTHQAVADSVAQLDSKRTGTFLSGGTDSSTVLGLVTYVTREPVNAFSIGFEEERYDELQWARLASERFGARHHIRTVTAADALAILPELVEAYDEPLGNNSMLGTFLCAQLAREHGVTRLLAGDGGDEIFGGNERYRMDQIFARWTRVPTALRRGLLEPILLNLPNGLPGPFEKARRYIRRASLPNPRRFYSYEFYVAQNAGGLLAPDFLSTTELDEPWRVLEEHFRRVSAVSELNRLLYLDLKLTIADNDLFKVTRTAEAAGIAVRFPLLSVPLVEFTGTLPARFKVRGVEKRYLFKRAFRVLVPSEILAKRKQGFGVPTSEWLRSDRRFVELARDTLLSARARERGYFGEGALEQLFALHAADSTPFYGDLLWSFLMLELWHQRHVDRSGEA
jgi:asparagine synthase (glutamine-hydrolysing)